MTIKVVSVPMGRVDEIWPGISDQVEEACIKGGGDLTAPYLWTECRNGSAFLFAVLDDEDIIAHSAWRFENWSTGRRLRCLYLWGTRMAEWKDEHVNVIRQLQGIGQAVSTITDGRMGFQKMFPEAKVIRQLYEVKL